MTTLRNAAVSTAVLMALSVAAPLPAAALQDRAKCNEAIAGANEFDIKTFCPRSEWPETYSGKQAKAVITAPVKAVLSAFGLR
jgi:hypothetical protein